MYISFSELQYLQSILLDVLFGMLTFFFFAATSYVPEDGVHCEN